ncbi:MAG: DUF5667 domain-containing protein [Firmicutes bacterium]|nr:DUF5667 domain-containing protein [Bacillota bacterium]
MSKSGSHNKKLENAFDYCMKLMNSGATIEECLRLYPNLRKELRDLLPVAARLKQAYPGYPELRPSKLYTKISREKFLAAIEGGPDAIERELFKPMASRTSNPDLGRLVRIYVGAAVVAAVMLMILGGYIYASDDILPGNPLYSVKRTLEGLHLALTFDNKKREELLRQFSARRMDEANRLGRKNKDRTAVLGYKVAKDSSKGKTENRPLNDSTSKGSSSVTPQASSSKQTSKKRRSKAVAVRTAANTTTAAATATSATYKPPVPSFEVESIDLQPDDCINTSKENDIIHIKISGATTAGFEVGIYKDSDKVAVAKPISVNEFSWDGKVNGSFVDDGMYSVKVVDSNGRFASATAEIFVASLSDVALQEPEGQVDFEAPAFKFVWSEVTDATAYTLYVKSGSRTVIEKLLDARQSQYKPDSSDLQKMLALGQGSFSWRIIATDTNGKLAYSAYKDFTYIRGSMPQD